MSKLRCFHVTPLFAMVLACACSQMAFASPRSASASRPRVLREVYPAPGLYPVTQAFTESSYPDWTNNSDGSELWPCFGPGNNFDCASIGNPAITFTGVAIGRPYFVWSLAACDGTTNGTQVPYVLGETWDAAAINGSYIPCGQITTFYQDYSNDNTDDLLWSAIVTQGGSVIADTGTQDWGPNPFNGELVVFYQDVNFGTLGDNGPNNGNCVPGYNYPGSSIPTTHPFIIAANKTCVDPVTGPATIAVTTTLATPTWTCKTKEGDTTCTVRYTRNYEIKQQWNVYLQ
jgi:hypothetical protein